MLKRILHSKILIVLGIFICVVICILLVNRFYFPQSTHRAKKHTAAKEIALVDNGMKIKLNSEMFSYVEIEDKVLWAYPTKASKKGALSAKLSCSDRFCSKELVLQDRQIANDYFNSQKASGAVRSVYLGDIGVTTHQGMWVYWYVEQYELQSSKPSVVKTYHFYIKRKNTDGYVKLDIQEIFAGSDVSSLTDEVAFRTLDSVVILDDNTTKTN